MINDNIKQEIEQTNAYTILNESMSEGLEEFVKSYISCQRELLLAGGLVLENEYGLSKELLSVLRSLPITLAAFKRLEMTEEEILEEIQERINGIINEN